MQITTQRSMLLMIRTNALRNLNLQSGFAAWVTLLALSLPSLFAQAPANSSGRAPGWQTPKPVLDGSARLLGPYDSKQMLRLVFGLQPPHLAEEEQFLHDLHTKGSPDFHHFLTPDEWNARFSPSGADEQAVVDWLQKAGLTITHRFSNRLLVDAVAPVEVIQKALNLTINSYQLG